MTVNLAEEPVNHIPVILRRAHCRPNKCSGQAFGTGWVGPGPMCGFGALPAGPEPATLVLMQSQGYAPNDLSLPEALAGIVGYKAHGRGIFDEDILTELRSWAPDKVDVFMAAVKGVTWGIDEWMAYTGARSGDELAQAVHKLMLAYELPVSRVPARDQTSVSRTPTLAPTNNGARGGHDDSQAFNRLADRNKNTADQTVGVEHLLPREYLDRLTPRPAERGPSRDDFGR